MNPYKERFARDDRRRARSPTRCAAPTCSSAARRPGTVTPEMVDDDGRPARSSSRWPTPIPRSATPRRTAARPDAIIATGRSDFPNQVNNVLGFPFIFRGALDVRARRDQRGDEDRRRARARRAGPRDGARVGRRGLRRRARSSSAPTTSSRSRSTRACCGGCAPAVAEAAMESGVARIDARPRRVPRAAAAAHRRHAHAVMRQIVAARQAAAASGSSSPTASSRKVLRACRRSVDEEIARPILLGARERDRASAPRELDLGDLLERVEIIDPRESPQLRRATSTSIWQLRAAQGRDRASTPRRLMQPAQSTSA